MACLSSVPGLVVLSPRRGFLLAGAKSRSMVAGLIGNNSSLTSGDRVNSPWRSKASTISGRDGCSRREQMLSQIPQIWVSAHTTSEV